MPIEKITITGYKSIRELKDYSLEKDINILIGANGSGKSNFVSFFQLLEVMLKQRLQSYIGTHGGPEAHLFLGSKETDTITGKIYFGLNGYEFDLVPSTTNKLVFRSEQLFFDGPYYGKTWENLGAGHLESLLSEVYAKVKTDFRKQKITYLYPVLSKCTIYHFHDTSDSARVKKLHSITDNEKFHHDASNLAAFLYNLRSVDLESYNEIRSSISLIVPFFDDFLLRPYYQDSNLIQLEWTQKNSDIPFHGSQLSDGTLRFICLATALLQPNPPDTILFDEPELGMHPYALTILSTLFYDACRRTQLIISTQSADLLSYFEPRHVTVVDRLGHESKFSKLEKDALQHWLDEQYSLGDLWRKNVIGGRP